MAVGRRCYLLGCSPASHDARLRQQVDAQLADSLRDQPSRALERYPARPLRRQRVQGANVLPKDTASLSLKTRHNSPRRCSPCSATSLASGRRSERGVLRCKAPARRLCRDAPARPAGRRESTPVARRRRSTRHATAPWCGDGEPAADSPGLWPRGRTRHLGTGRATCHELSPDCPHCYLDEVLPQARGCDLTSRRTRSPGRGRRVWLDRRTLPRRRGRRSFRWVGDAPRFKRLSCRPSFNVTPHWTSTPPRNLLFQQRACYAGPCQTPQNLHPRHGT